MKVRLKIAVGLLLAVAAAWYFWPRAARPGAGQTLVAQTPANIAGGPATAAASAAAVAKDEVRLSAASTNQLTFRLANTSKSISQLSRDRHAILMENAFIDTAAALTDLKIPTHLKAGDEPGAYIVQARGPIDGGFRAAIGGAGGTVVSYIPNNAYLVQVSSAGAAVLTGNPLVQAVLPYEPYYKVQSTLLGLAVNQKPLPAGTYLTLGLFAAGADATEAQLQQLGAPILSKDRSPFGPIVRVQPPPDWLALVNLPGVQIVEPVYRRKLANDLSRVALGVSTNTTDGATNDYLGLTGKNILVEVNDTGIDPNHPDFSVTGTAANPGTSPPSRVMGDSPNSLYDTDGHGTHVAGIIAGNGSESYTITNAPGSVTNADFRGKAPAAKLYAVGGIDGGNDTDFFTDDSYLQEAPARTNALISNNSWEYGNPAYDLAAASYDAAVRDAVPEMTGPQPVLFVFAAGNDGGGNDNGSGGTADTVSSPGTAKDVITIGSLEQLRNITNIVTALDGSSNAIWAAQTDSGFQVAGYSSRGNVGVQTEGSFGRFKPDVVAPGTFVISTRSTVWDEAAYYNVTNNHVNETIDFVDTNTLAYGFLQIPQNAVAVTIQVVPNFQSPSPFPTNFPIYVSASDVPDPTDPTTYDFVTYNNFASVPPGGGTITSITPLLNGGLIYAVADPLTNASISFDVIETIVTTNDLGNELMVLSNLNDSLDGDRQPHYYRFETGTSMATAAASGVLALMQDFFVNQTYEPNFTTNPSPALLKAMVINGARLTGNYQFAVTNTENFEGWGQLQLPNSIPAALTNAAISTTTSNGLPLFFIDQSPTNALATGESRTYNVSVPSAVAQSQALRVTLAWTDPPGNPAAAIKLVNNLSLVVTNLTNPTNPVIYFGNSFSASGSPPYSSPGSSNSLPDNINNVQNVFLSPTLGTNYSVTVYANAVNVNAVTAEQTNIVQDFALVISCGDGGNTNGIVVTPVPPVPGLAPVVPNVSFLPSTNTIYFNQYAGANAPWENTNDLSFGTNSPYATNAVFHIGQTNQWHFYVVTNTTTFTNAAFILFQANTAALPREGVFADSEANSTTPEADLTLLVASAPDANAATLTNLSVNVISNCLFSLNGDQAAIGPGVSSFVAYTNSQANQVYYIGVQCQDQTAGQYAFVPIFSETPFSTTDKNGNVYVHGLNMPVNIPDGDNRYPGVGYVFGLCLQPIEVKRVIETNTFFHQNFGDLTGTMSHSGAFATLNNHDGLGLVDPTQLFIYDDSGQGDILGAMHSDGPGSLANFVGSQAAGLWELTEVDNSFTQTGRVNSCELKIEPHRNLSNQPFVVVSVPAGGWFYDYVDVPAGYTNLLVVATNLAPTVVPPVQLYVKEGVEPTLADTNDNVSLTNCAVGTYPTGINPGNSISVGPPLTPDRYFVGLYNPGGTAATVLVGAILSYNASAVTTLNAGSGGVVPILDDAVTTDSVFVTNTAVIQNIDVGLRIDHPRISDLAITLISPDGSRYLLMENRGGQTTNGCGVTVIATNVFSATANGSAQPNTNYLNLSSVSGSLPITYNFYTAPDEMTIYYGTNITPANVIYDTGEISNPPGGGGGAQNTIPQTFILNYGPTNGIVSQYITIVMDEFLPTNRPDAWTYTAGGVETNYEYLTFTDDTNLTTTPVKFAPPPFAPNYAVGVVWTDSFEAYQPVAYAQGGAGFGGWSVLTNDVEIVTNPPAFDGVNLLQLDNGAVTTSLPTVPGQKYVLSYELGSKTLEGGSPATNANWVANSVAFIASPAGSPLTLDASGGGFNQNSVLTTGFDSNSLLDFFQLTEVPQDIYYQPEQSLTPLVNTSGYGIWQLEILDNRAGATNIQPELISWHLGLTYANTGYTIPQGTLLNGQIQTNYAAPGSLTWFQIDVPPNAVAQTNTLVFASLPLNIWFSTNAPPTTNSPSVEEQTNSLGGSVVVYPNSVPPMVPGSTNYLGVQNPNQFGANYAVVVNFDLPPPTNGPGTAFASTLPATRVTGTNAQLNGFATPHGTNSAAWFEWGVNTNYGNGTPAVAVGNGFGVVYQTNLITNLIFAEVYHARLVVSNAFGTVHGADVLFAPGQPMAWGLNNNGQATIPTGLSNVVAVAGGLYHSLALLDNLTVTAWGDNTYGQTNVPAGLTNVAAIAAGGLDSLALRTDGTVVEWGDNTDGETNVLDSGSNSNVVMIAAGESSSVALLADGTVRVWGDGSMLQTDVPLGLSNVVAVSSGGSGVIALLNNGKVINWGDLNQGYRNVPPALTNVVAIAEGDDSHSLALSNNAVIGWGAPLANSLPVPPGLTSNVVAIAAGQDDSLVLLNNGKVVAWGSDTDNETNVPPGLGPVFAVACGTLHDLVLTAEPPVLPPYASALPATLVTGTNAQINGFATANNNASTAWFQWGASTNYGNLTPPVSLSAGYQVMYLTNRIAGLIYGQAYHYQLVVSNALGVTASFDQLLVAGSTIAWGDNTFAQSTPPAGFSNVVTVAAGGYHSLEALNNGAVQAWGDNANGQTTLPSSLGVVTGLAGGLAHSLALLGNGLVAAWGDNTFGQTDVPAVSNVVMVAAGGYANLVLLTNGLPVSWGDGTVGQTNIPGGLTNVVEVAEGAQHSLALLNNGTVTAWGDNTYGQTTLPPGLGNVVAVSAGYYHSLALLSNGVVVAWGNDTLGQTNVPAGLSNVVAIAAGGYHNTALRSDGSVIAWGNDTLGETNVPANVSNVVAVAAGGYHNVVLASPFGLNLNLFPFPTNGLPLTNVVGAGSINWYQINVPTNATAATNTLVFATLPVNLWWSSNAPPTITSPKDAELLTNQTSGTRVLYPNTPPPTIVPGGIYYLGVQNPNATAVTNALQVTFDYAPVAPILPVIPFQLVESGTTLTVTNTASYPLTPLNYSVTNILLFAFPPGATNFDYPVINPANGVITWATSTNDPFGVSRVTTVVMDPNTGLSATNSFFVVVFPQFNIGAPNTNSVPPNGIVWYPVQVPVNALAATNTLVSASAPVNLWYSTNLPPTIINPGDLELLNNAVNGTYVIGVTNTTPVLMPGGLYFLGVQNPNGFTITESVEVTFRYPILPPILPVIPTQVIAGGDTLLVTNTAMDTNSGAVLVYYLTNSPAGAAIDTNGIITWPTTPGIAPTNTQITTVVTDTTTGLSATNSFAVIVLPQLTDGQPATNIVGAGSIFWYLVKVPYNADIAANYLLFATAPVNLWFSTNAPPSVTNSADFEMLTHSIGGQFVMHTNTPPLLRPGTQYYLGVQNPNAFAVTNAVEVKFHLTVPTVFSIFSIVHTNNAGTNGFLLTWYAPTNTQFHLQWTPSLLPTTWTNFKGVISFTSYQTAVSSQFQYFDDGSQTGGFGPTRFYRLLLLNSPTNTAPEFLLPPALYTAVPLTLFTVTNSARDWDLPPQHLTYFVTNSLPGTNVAVVGANTGVITWTPDLTQAGLTNFITIIVTDDGVPAKSATNFLAVAVGTSSVPMFGGISITTNGVSLQWHAPTNDQFSVRWTTNLLPPITWTVFPPPPITSTNGLFQFTDTNQLLLMRFYQLILLP